MKKKIFKYLVISLVIGVQILPIVALAQSTDPDTIPTLNIDANNLVDLFDQIKTWFAEAIFILGIAVILYAAFLYMTSAGDDSRIEKAKKTFIYGIVGIIIAMLAYGIWTTVQTFLEQ